MKTTLSLSALLVAATVPAVALGEPAAAPAPKAAAEVTSGGLDAKLAALVGRPGGLTSDAVAARAADTSFDVKARHEELLASGALVDQAFVQYFPRLSALARYTRLSPIESGSVGNLVAAVDPVTQQPVPAGIVPGNAVLVSVPFSFPVILNQYTLQATLSVPLSDYLLRIPQANAAATGSERAAKLTEVATRLKVQSDARLGYYTWVRAKLQALVTEQALDQARAHLADAKHAFDAGTVSNADVLRVESQVASAELLVERAKNLAELTATQLRIAMHDDGRAPYEIGEDVTGEAAPIDGASRSLDELYREASANRFEARAIDESARGLGQQAAATKSAAWPRVDALGNLTAANPNQRYFPQRDEWKTTWDASLQLTWSPNDYPSAVAGARSVTAKAASAEAQRAQLLDGIRAEVTQAQQAVREADVAIRTTARGLAAAEESYRVRKVLFQNGRATNVELTDAETELTRARLESINARVDQRVARVKLTHALGRDGASSR